MAENLDIIEGDAIMGRELLYPRQIWEPNQPDTIGKTIHFSRLVKGVSDDARMAIVQEGGFRGNVKPYDRSEDGTYMNGRFSWWSVDVPPEEVRRLKQDRQEGEEVADIYAPGSRYGTNLFRCDLDRLLLRYRECSGVQPEIRVLATYKYTREVMHAFVVAPKDDTTFQRHPLVARYADANDFQMLRVMVEYNAIERHIVQRTYSWNPFSVIRWNNLSSTPKQRMYAHQAFAFYLEPLENHLMIVPEVEEDDNWRHCILQDFKLITSLQRE